MSIDHLLENETNPQPQFSAQSFINGVLSFGAILGDQRILVCSDGNILLADNSNNDSFRFKKSTLTAKAIKRFRAGENVDGKELLGRIQAFLLIISLFRTPEFLYYWQRGSWDPISTRYLNFMDISFSLLRLKDVENPWFWIL